MSIIYNTRYGATINGKHTFADYGLLPTSPPVIEPPEPKLYTVEIPGMNGVLDLSEALTGDVRFGMRTGIFTYQIYGTRSTWRQVYRTLLEDIHGQSCTVVLDEEPDVTYTGRVQITAFEPDGKAGKCIISLEGSFYPWPTKMDNTGNNWLWDPFNFETDTAPPISSISKYVAPGDSTTITLNNSTSFAPVLTVAYTVPADKHGFLYITMDDSETVYSIYTALNDTWNEDHHIVLAAGSHTMTIRADNSSNMAGVAFYIDLEAVT